MHKFLRLLLVALLVVTAASCDPAADSTHPIGSWHEAIDDTALIGVWESKNEDGQITRVYIGRSRGYVGEEQVENLLAFTWIGIAEEDGRLINVHCPFYAVEVGDEKYLNLPSPLNQTDPNLSSWDLSETEAFTFHRYEVDDGELRFYTLETELVYDAINSGQLEGEGTLTTEDGVRKFEDVRLTDSSESIQAFLEGGGNLFSEKPMLVLTRVEE